MISRRERRTWNLLRSPYFARLLDALRAGKRCIVADIDFTRTEARADATRALGAMAPTLQPTWTFFANDPVQCRVNVLASARESNHIRLFEIDVRSPEYQIPAGAHVLPVWSGAVA